MRQGKAAPSGAASVRQECRPPTAASLKGRPPGGTHAREDKAQGKTDMRGKQRGREGSGVGEEPGGRWDA